MTDKQLIEGLRKGDMVAFGEMYRGHREPLVRFARLPRSGGVASVPA